MGSVCTKSSADSSETGLQKPEPNELLSNTSRRRLSLTHSSIITHESPDCKRGTVLIENRPRLDMILREDFSRGPRMSITGAQADRLQGNFESKVEKQCGNMKTSDLEDYGIGYVCRKGLKPESPNQDDFFVYLLGSFKIFGVFDGHGPYGAEISNFVQQRLAKLLWEHKEFSKNVQEALRQAFSQVQEEIKKSSERGDFDATLSGCTATVIIHDKETHKIHAAHVGDSRAVLGCLINGNYHSTTVTEDHKPTLEKEYARIIAAGGRVKRLTGDIPHRVFLKNKQYPGLAMSRAFGDLIAVQAGVIAEPEIQTFAVDPAQQPVLIVCSDGVWEFINTAEAISNVTNVGVARVQNSAEGLAREAWNRWIDAEGDIVDDITVEVAYLYYDDIKQNSLMIEEESASVDGSSKLHEIYYNSDKQNDTADKECINARSLQTSPEDLVKITDIASRKSAQSDQDNSVQKSSEITETNCGERVKVNSPQLDKLSTSPHLTAVEKRSLTDDLESHTLVS